MRRAPVFCLMLLLSTFVLAACNTVRGAGEDIKAGGEGIEGAAEETKPY